MNSPIKPPVQNVNKESTPNIGRRTSVSQGQTNTYSNDGSSGRPGNRRRDSGDLLRGNVLTSPTSRFSRDDTGITSPSTLTRRRTDQRDNGLSLNTDDRDQNMGRKEYTPPFAALKRTATGPVSAGLNGPSSPWSNAPQSAHLSNMGSFGSFPAAPGSAQPSTPGEKKSGLGRGESRFKGLMSNDNTDETRTRMREKGSLSSLERLLETSNEHGARELDPPRTSQSRRFPVSAIDDEGMRTGSAALGGDDTSPSQHNVGQKMGSNAQSSYEDIGFASLDLAPDASQRRDMPSQRGQQVQQQSNEPPSPTITNPYQSPQIPGASMLPRDLDLDDPEDYLATQHPIPTRNLQSQMESRSVGDRSQTSSAGPPRQFPSLGVFGGLSNLTASGPWSAAPGSGNASRAYPSSSLAIGESIMNALDSAGTPLHQGSRFFDAGGSAPIGLPRQSEQNHVDSDNPQRLGMAPGVGRTVRDTDSPMRSGRGVLDDLFTNLDNRRGGVQMNDQNLLRSGQGSAQPTQSSFSSASMPVGTPSSGWPGGVSFGRSQEQEQAMAPNSLPNAQQRQMVMPDRMRWIYRDPSGNTQGPWSGLEMHDWYKAGFFSPELQVKKLEDTDYEPLAQLIRRIGNSREPFLVPQIGIAHGQATTNAAAGATGSSAPQAGPASSAQPPSAQPPFASSFPSFGTTLTAEQQNALERRKQEEQYLMARQKEHLAQQQVIAKMNMHNQQLHHHSSAHSLQSQPSYGSMTSPSAFQPPMGPIQPPSANFNFFDHGRSGLNLGPGSISGIDGLGSVREEDTRGYMERMHAQRAGQPYDGPFPSSNQMEGMNQQKQVNAMLQDRAYLQQEQDRFNAIQNSNEDLRGQQRLEQFRALQVDNMDELAQQGQVSQPISQHQSEVQRAGISTEDFEDELQDQVGSVPTNLKRPQSLSLTEQVQEAASKSSVHQTQSPWAKAPSSMTQPMPPPQSTSPLPAPAAQRNRQHFADVLHADLRSSPESPSAETPSANVAPWAKETNESSKGPSLKEIQATEAKKAAQAEEIAAAQRKAQMEEERRNQPASVAAAPAPGLPSSANWASSVSPATPATTVPPWAKSGVPGKVAAAPPSGSKKTLSQIQKEEETRKQRAAAAATVAGPNMAAVAPLAGGKRYADLASKTAPAAAQATPNIWTTVGAGGKVRTPSGAAPVPVSRTVNGMNATPLAATKGKPASSAKQSAQDDLQKWTKNALSKGLNPTIAGWSSHT